jgi:uncharacterized SAM-binding protein YcdF (DUF218 family)
MELTPLVFGLYKFVKHGLYLLTWMVLLLNAATVWPPPFSAKTPAVGVPAVMSSRLLLVTLSSPLVATSLFGSLESWYNPPQLTPSDRFDAIVVLGGGIDEKGSLRPATEPSPYSRIRTTCGVDLYQQSYAPTLVLTGGETRGFGTSPQVAVEIKHWAVRLDVPESATMIDTETQNTYENATGTKRLIGPASILIVGSASHLPRAVSVFTKQGFRVTPAPLRLYLTEPAARELGRH